MKANTLQTGNINKTVFMNRLLLLNEEVQDIDFNRYLRKRAKVSNLYHAISNLDLEKIKLLLSSELDFNIQNSSDGKTALHAAVAMGSYPIVKKLIEKGSNVNIADNDGSNTLHIAVCTGPISIVKTLLENHANVHALDNLSRSPLSNALVQVMQGLAPLPLMPLMLKYSKRQEWDYIYPFSFADTPKNSIKVLLESNAKCIFDIKENNQQFNNLRLFVANEYLNQNACYDIVTILKNRYESINPYQADLLCIELIEFRVNNQILTKLANLLDAKKTDIDINQSISEIRDLLIN